MIKKCANCLFWSANVNPPEKPEGEYPCLNENVGGDKGGEHGTDCDYFLGSDSTEANVPDHTPKGIMDDKFRNTNPVAGVHILIVTYAKDFECLVYALRCARKHLSGFTGLTVAFPRHEMDRFRPLTDQFDVILHGYDEVPGKGFLQHESKMGQADMVTPPGTKFVMHMDADCNFHTPTTPRDYFLNDKPMYLYRTWESLISPDPRDPLQKIVSDCMMWKEPTSAQLGYQSDVYTMTRHPTVFPVDFYPRYRAHIESHHRIGFEQYFLSGNHNTHPQDRMDFTAMGQFAWTHMRDRFHWINVATEEYPADRQWCFWSHSGVTPEVRAKLEGFLKD